MAGFSYFLGEHWLGLTHSAKTCRLIDDFSSSKFLVNNWKEHKMTAWPTLHQVNNLAVSSLLLPDWSIPIFFLQISFLLLVGLYLPVLLGYFCNPHIIVELRWTVRTELEYRDRAIVHWLSYNRNAQPCPHQSSLNEFYFLIFYLIDVKKEDSSFMIYGFIYFFF